MLIDIRLEGGTLDWYYFLAGPACSMLYLLFIEYDDITCSAMVLILGS